LIDYIAVTLMVVLNQISRLLRLDGADGRRVILGGVRYVVWAAPTGSLKADRDRPAAPRGSGALIDHP